MQAVNTALIDEFVKALEPVVRRIIREELDLMLKKHGPIFFAQDKTEFAGKNPALQNNTL